MRILGPFNAPIVILVDYPSSQEFLSKEPLSDYRAGLFFSLLAKAGILKTSCMIVSLLDEPLPEEDPEVYLPKRKTCPGPEWRSVKGKWVHPVLSKALIQLQDVFEKTSPSVVIALGELSLWALTGNQGLSKWRGSRLSPPQWPFTVVPTYHPRSAQNDHNAKVSLQIDLARVKAIYEGKQLPRDYNFEVEPTFGGVVSRLQSLVDRANTAQRTHGRLMLSGDLETRAGHIACFGIAWSAVDAICIPFITTNDVRPFYWEVDEEVAILRLIATLFHHPAVHWVGQNYLYDCQYFWRHWGILPINVRDTMIGHHSIYGNLRKGLDFLSSMYAQDHVYWKDEIKEWDASIGEKQYWIYNCKDACITHEIWPEIETSIIDNLMGEHAAFQQSLFFPVLRMMNRGIRLNTKLRGEPDGYDFKKDRIKFTGLKEELLVAQEEREARLEYLVGHPLKAGSPVQLKNFFYNDLGIAAARHITTGKETTNSDAMVAIAEKEPLLKPICQLIVELRSIGVFLGTFIDARLDSDGRMRCSFSVAGPITYRFSSSENAFGSGMNLQNIPVAEKAKIKDKDYIKLPNIRKLFIPDPGYTFFDMDLDRADLQVVVWEADDSDMKRALRLGLDMHCINACDIYDIKGIPYDELTETHPNYEDHRGRIGKPKRDKAKIGVHATNYGVGDRKLAQALGITTHEAALFRARWFGRHPGVRRWHLRTEHEIAKKGYLENRFGARLYNFSSRLNLPEFLGWLPQSTVAGVINRGLVRIDEEREAGRCNIDLLIQVHDSLAGQFPTREKATAMSHLKEMARVEIPYDEPLVIPVGIKTSEISWGDCK